MQFIILTLQRDLGEKIDKLGALMWGLKLKYTSRYTYKLK